MKKNLTKAETRCLCCDKIVIGRSDKKFCDDYCRSAFNNELNANNSTIISETNKILKKNRTILQNLNSTDKSKVSRKELQEKGFNFGYFTGIFRTSKGSVYIFCYEMGYLSLSNDKVLLVSNTHFPRWKGQTS
ncbi:MAG: hypothetical protein P0Y49_13635 [Candidatus Pedobacter colombiensis]|uniref:DUF2116 family Zn-ribbon domain-containing protein n=1 Tax=Candidatus Pedobacter colombiensis TaxID=3121371 RepID=A0AAJ5W5A6_9SPHI|nr:hypothetical protein [Pedobacter sp.]WEK17840.1 MAG: hypothetical protein P0Y49_13635 [Pedobacter sp.]